MLCVALSSVGAGGCWQPRQPADDFRIGRSRQALSTGVSVLTQHNDLARTGANLDEALLTTSNVRVGAFGKLTSLPVTGQVYAQPLYVSGAIDGKDVVYLATEANNVYAYTANAPWELIWSRITLESPWMSTACPNTQPLIGISSTPVIDASTRTLFVTTKRNSGTAFQYMLHALDLATGEDKPGSPIDMGLDASGMPVSVAGTGDGSQDGRLTFDPMLHQNRVALTLSQGVLSVGFASHCDRSNYHGWLLRFDVTSSPMRPLTPYVTNPDTGHGGLWMGGAGISVDEKGDLYLVSGDGRAGLTDTSGTQLANAFIALTDMGIGGTPKVASWFMPSNVVDLDNADADIGSAGPLLIPGTSLLVGGGKNGILYLLQRDAMGKFVPAAAPDPLDPQIVQRFSASTNNGQIIGSPIFWESPAGPRMYVWPGRSTLNAFAFDRATERFNTTPVSSSADNPRADVQGGLLSLTANGSAAGTGIVWATHALAGTGGGNAVAGVLYAFNAQDLSQRLWDSTQVPSDGLASFSKFTPPTIANGKVYVGTFSDKVEVYGLLPSLSDAGAAAPDGASSEAGETHTAGDAGPLPVLSCATVATDPPQRTDWTYVFDTYFAGTVPLGEGTGTAGHCAECHSATLGGFQCGADKDSCYLGLINAGQITPDAGASSAIGDPLRSPLAWFGNPDLPPGVYAPMPEDQPVRNERAVAAVCGWLQAGARNDKTDGQACTFASECGSGFCADGVCGSAARSEAFSATSLR